MKDVNREQIAQDIVAMKDRLKAENNENEIAIAIATTAFLQVLSSPKINFIVF